MIAAAKQSSLPNRGVLRQLQKSIADCQRLVEEKKEWLAGQELKYCAAEMERVAGALRIVSNRTPSILANEIGRVFALVKDNAGADKNLALMLIANSLSVLSESIEKKVTGADANYRLLSLINKLRALRGEKPMPASEVYSIDLDVVPVNQNLDATAKNFIAVAASQGPKFQAALLAWYQDCRNPNSINALVAITDSLRLAASERPHIQFFEVIAALIESQRGCPHVNQAIRLLLAHVERYLRQLADADSVESYVPTALTREALYHLAANAHQQSERVAGMLGRYGLRDRRSVDRNAVKDKADQDKTDNGLTEIKTESSVQALRECRRELSAVEEALESWLAAQASVAVLSEAYDSMYRVRRCFELLGLLRQAKICALSEDFLIELQACDSPNNLDPARYMLFAEAIAALSYAVDEESHSDSVVSLDINDLLELAETRMAKLGGHENTAQAAPPIAGPTASAEVITVNDFMEDTEDLLGDFDSLLETSDLLSLSDEEMADVGSAEIAEEKGSQDLVSGFIAESSDLLDDLDGALLEWREDGKQKAPIHALLRLLHTLKGSARVAGYRGVGDLSHSAESMLSSVLSGVLPATPALIESLQQMFTAMRNMLAVGEHVNHPERQAQIPQESTEQQSEPVTAPPQPLVHTKDAEEGFKVAGERLQRLFQLNAEGLVGQAALFSDVSQAMTVALEFDPIIHRLSHELDDELVSPDHKVRLNEAVNDLRLATNQVLHYVDSIEKRLAGLSDAAACMRQILIETRMVAIEADVMSYRRLVEQTSEQLHKEVMLSVSGVNIRLHRAVLPRISAVLGHLLRNAVDHGVELESVRLNAGKAACATIAIDCVVNTDGIVMTVTDDGSGIDTRTVWRRAVAKNLLADDEPFSEEKAIELLFDPALSTKSQLTQVSGRGVGLDAVKTEINRLGGAIAVSSEFGKGASFSLRLPYYHGLVTATIVRIGGQYFALPGLTEAVVIDVSQAGQCLTVDDIQYECRNMAQLLAVRSHHNGNSPAQALLVHKDDNSYALIVDSVEGVEDILLEPPGPQLSYAGYLAGIGLLEEGELLAVLNPSYFLVNSHGHDIAGRAAEEAPAITAESQQKTILVVDDSLTTRRYCQGLLEAQGYHVLVAKTAEEAIDVAKRVGIDALVSDLQLPKMDGFDLADNLRRLPHYERLPVVLMSASPCDDAKLEQHAIAAWLNKPYRERELYQTLERLLKH